MSDLQIAIEFLFPPHDGITLGFKIPPAKGEGVAEVKERLKISLEKALEILNASIYHREPDL